MSDVRDAFDPSKLHLKKELTAIRKAARVLRDPGTTSSWRSPLNSSRSITNAATADLNSRNLKFSENPSQLPSKISGNGNAKRVFLYNWKTQRSSSEKTTVDPAVERGEQGVSGSADDTLSDAKNGSLPTPLMRRSIASKKKLKKKAHSAALSINHHQQQQQKMLDGVKNSENSKRLIEGTSFSEDLQLCSASPLLSRLRKGNWPPQSSSSKLLRKDDSSCTYSTPALSTSSYNRYGLKNPSTVGSWDGTTASYNDGDDDDHHLELPGRQGCGIPCYWSKKTPKHRRVCGGCYSASLLSATLRRKGSRILYGSQTMSNRRRVLPLLTNSCDGRGMGSSIGTGCSDDDLSTNFGELDLEGLSRLDGRRWSSHSSSQEGLNIVDRNEEREEEDTPEKMKSLSQKYRPIFFDELIGQNIVVQSLVNAISKRRIAPVYLFHGPRGTGKTSTARIFAAALNCINTTEETKPCGYCRECSHFVSGKSRYLIQVDGTNKKGIHRIRYLFKNLPMRSSSAYSPFNVFAIDECHLIPSKTWLAFLKFLKDPPPRVVFVFMTTDLDNVPLTVLSRCQKYLFNKIKDDDIMIRLRKIVSNENLDVESDALDLIALNADGSLRDAETMLDQLSLLGKRITTSLINELVGIVSDEKLLELLELAMSSDTAETVKRARELMDSGADPMVLMSQLACLIMDIVAGSCHNADAKFGDSFFGGHSLTEAEPEMLKHALKILSEAEKQLRVSSERSTWFTATLLQLGSVPSPDHTLSSTSWRRSSETTEEDPSSTSKEASVHKQKLMSPASLPKATNNTSIHQQSVLSLVDGLSSKPTHSRLTEFGASHDDATMLRHMGYRSINVEKLDNIWSRCIDRCHSKRLRQLLYAHGKLVSISEVEGALVACIAFGNGDIKSRAERFLSSIKNSFEIVLRSNVEIRIILLPNGEASTTNTAKSDDLTNSLLRKQIETNLVIERERKALNTNMVDKYSDMSSQQEQLKVSRGSFNDSDGSLVVLSEEQNSEISVRKGRKQVIPLQRIESIIREQRLETAWLQATDRSTPGSMSRSKPEKNQVLPHYGIFRKNQIESMSSIGMSSQNWEDDLNHELKVLKINEGKAIQKDQTAKRFGHYPMSPSLLHDNSFVGNFTRDNLGYESGPGTGGCSGLFCWNNTKPHNREKVKQGNTVGSHRGGRCLWFRECLKSDKTEENRPRR